MTPRQMYSELAKIAAHRSYDGKKFVVSKRVGREHLRIVQSRMAALLMKLNYERTFHDFREITRAQEPSPDYADAQRLTNPYVRVPYSAPSVARLTDELFRRATSPSLEEATYVSPVSDGTIREIVENMDRIINDDELDI